MAITVQCKTQINSFLIIVFDISDHLYGSGFGLNNNNNNRSLSNFNLDDHQGHGSLWSEQRRDSIKEEEQDQDG